MYYCFLRATRKSILPDLRPHTQASNLRKPTRKTTKNGFLFSRKLRESCTLITFIKIHAECTALVYQVPGIAFSACAKLAEQPHRSYSREAQVDYDVGPLALPCVISTVHRAQLFTLSREVITALIESSMLVLWHYADSCKVPEPSVKAASDFLGGHLLQPIRLVAAIIK